MTSTVPSTACAIAVLRCSGSLRGGDSTEMATGKLWRQFLAPRHLVPEQVDEGFIGRHVLGVLLFGSDPQVNFRPGWVRLAPGEGSLHRIAHLMSLRISGAFHHHEMCRVVLIKERSI